MKPQYVIQYRNAQGRMQFIRDLKNDQRLSVEFHKATADKIAAKFTKGRVIDITLDANLILIHDV